VADLVSLNEAKAHLRVTSSDEDLYISTLITAANDYVSQYLNRPVAPKTFNIAYDSFSNAMPLSADVQSVNYIKYIDVNNVEQTLSSANYELDTYVTPAVIRPVYNYTYPNILNVANAVKISYVAGFTDGDSPDTYPMPVAIKQAMLLVIGDLYANREAQVEKVLSENKTVQNLLHFYRIEIGV